MDLMLRLKKKANLITASVAGVAMTVAVPVMAFADTTGTADPTVVTAFTSLKGDVMATLGTVAALGVAVMGTFLAWKYGKKIFGKVAN